MTFKLAIASAVVGGISGVALVWGGILIARKLNLNKEGNNSNGMNKLNIPDKEPEIVENTIVPTPNNVS